MKNNFILFNSLYKELEKGELIDKLVDLRRVALGKSNPKAYVISSLKKHLLDKEAQRIKQVETNLKQQKKRSNDSLSVKDILNNFK